MTTSSTETRRHSATWYAWGRKDERRGHPANVGFDDDAVDVFEFAEWAAQQYRDMESGAVGFCPSVQEQWSVYVWQKQHPEGR